MKSLLITILLGFSSQVIAQQLNSYFVPMDDGVKLAVDVHTPEVYKEGELPVLIQFERYWRSSLDKNTPEAGPGLTDRDKFFNDNGYIVVIVDTRGTGASFGTRLSEYSPIEVMDASTVLDWVVAQPWSNGRVGSYGTSYTGTTAELLCATKHESIKAVIPGWSDFDLYRSPARPYGLIATKFIKKWGMYVKFLDRNKSMLLGSSINPVIEDSLKAALAEHKDNIDVYTMVKEGEYRDSDNIPYNYEECSVVHWKKQIEESKVPMLVLASWMDAGTAEGTIQRLEHFSNPQKILLMATAHGGWCNASPFAVQDTLYYPKPLMQEQTQLELDFLDHYVKGIDKGVEEWPLIKYYNLGEEEFRTSNEWPIAGTREINYYFQKEGGLTTLKPTEPSGSDDYKVDFSVYTSKKNRWTTQMEGPVFNLNNRNEMDERMLVYTSEPAKEDIQITGTPVVSLQMSSTHTDGAVLVYLEDVDENGNSTYITEGGLRLIHRAKLADTSSSLNLHSFNEADAKLMTPYVVDDVEFKLWPTSVLIKKGHSIRIAIAGADKSVFDRLPKNGTPVINIQRSSTQLSFVTLPVVE